MNSKQGNLLKQNPIGANDPVPETQGRVIRWASFYDLAVKVLSIGKDTNIRRLTVELAHIQPGDRVLDVGCGTGDLTIRAKKAAGQRGQVAGIDASREMIDVARRKAARRGISVDFQAALVEALPFPDGSFDTVLSSLMIHHLPDDLKRRAFAEIRRVLKPGGQLLIVDLKRLPGIMGHLGMVFMAHGHVEVGVQDLTVMLKEAGFVNVEAGDASIKVVGYVRGFTSG